MKKYNYEDILYNDIKNYIQDNNININDYTKEDFFDFLDEELWAEDSITGNGPYGYANEEECAEYVGDNLKLAFTALRDFEVRMRDVPDEYPAKYMDSTIRCYLFHGVLQKVVDELYPEDK